MEKQSFDAILLIDIFLSYLMFYELLYAEWNIDHDQNICGTISK